MLQPVTSFFFSFFKSWLKGHVESAWFHYLCSSPWRDFSWLCPAGWDGHVATLADHKKVLYKAMAILSSYQPHILLFLFVFSKRITYTVLLWDTVLLLKPLLHWTCMQVCIHTHSYGNIFCRGLDQLKSICHHIAVTRMLIPVYSRPVKEFLPAGIS